MKKSKLNIALSIFIAVLIASLTFHSCFEKKEEAIKGDEVTLTFWHSLVSSSVPALEELLQKFEDENPGIKIKAQYIPSGNSMLYKLVTAVQSGTTPDISWIYAGSYKDLAEADAIYPMDHFINGENGISEEELNDFYEALYPLSTWKDVRYSLPMEATNFGLVYNKKMFEEAGLTHPPRDWNEFYEYSKKLSVDKNNDGKLERAGVLLPVYPAAGALGGFMVWQWVPFLWQAGGYVVNEEQTQSLFNSDAGIQALELWQKIYTELNLGSFTADHSVAFASGLAAMMFDGPWNLPQYEETLKNIDWAVAPLPEGIVQKATNAGGEFLVIFKDTEYPEEAWQFVKWIIKPETQAFWSMKSGYLPVRKSVLDVPEYQEFLDEHPNLKVYVEQMEFAKARRPLDYHGIQIDKFISEAIEEATIGNMDAREALNKAAERGNKLLQQNL